MPSYSNGLAPWERKNAYYSVIQLGKDVKTQTKILNKQTEALIATQIASTSEIISSQERISEGIDNVAYGLENVEEGIYGLKAAFEWGISEVVWQIEQNRHVLQGILQVLMAPLDTQAKELRKRAQDAYSNGWFEDALEDFLESEKKNKYDFIVHTSIGMIYLFQKIDKEKALDYFDKAIKYAKPKSPYHASYALLYKALIKRDFGLIEEAEECTEVAVKLCPDFAEALYQNAQYNALLNRPAKAIPLLRKAIEMDVNYCAKICNERDFDKIRPYINELYVELRDEQKQKSTDENAFLTRKLDKFYALIDEIRNHYSFEIHDEEIKKSTKRIKELIGRNSCRDYLEANTLLSKLSVLIQKQSNEIKTQLEKLIASYNSRMGRNRADKDCQINKSLEKIKLVLKIGIPVSIFLFGYVGCWIGTNLHFQHFQRYSSAEGKNSAKGFFLFFGTPMCSIMCGIIITSAIYLILYLIIKSEGKATPLETVGIKSSIERLQDILRKLEKI